MNVTRLDAVAPFPDLIDFRRKYIEINSRSDFLTVLQREDHDNGLDATLDDEVSTPLKAPSVSVEPAVTKSPNGLVDQSDVTKMPNEDPSGYENRLVHTAVNKNPIHFGNLPSVVIKSVIPLSLLLQAA
ncbi:imidazole glycerol phosphate synthase subunit HisF [Striga asiatica]|uniref:Imidazole glycerol phosphate synthase subunit HisF n=1 Tax=Striga asiatica TaxID=4170 RepID=A0A5A7QP86_STRAF|nr:imidazole glycerol phosphate synthase subunit HisF [Striga asiatica]